jgi:hypothetical protein
MNGSVGSPILSRFRLSDFKIIGALRFAAARQTLQFLASDLKGYGARWPTSALENIADQSRKLARSGKCPHAAGCFKTANNLLPIFRSAVSDPCSNRSNTGCRSALASSFLFCLARRFARSMAVRNSHASAP